MSGRCTDAGAEPHADDPSDFPCTDDEFDRAFLRTQRSDAPYVAVRVVVRDLERKTTGTGATAAARP